MKISKNQLGFSAVEIVLVLAIVGLFGFVGYKVYSQQQTKTADNSSQNVEQSATANDVPSAPQIKTTDDLTKAEKTLDSTSVDGSNDSSQLDNELSAF